MNSEQTVDLPPNGIRAPDGFSIEEAIAVLAYRAALLAKAGAYEAAVDLHAVKALLEGMQ